MLLLTFEWDVIRTGLLNTVLGMGTVFVVLIFIILLISCFSFIPKIQARFEKKNEAAAPAERAAPVQEAIPAPVVYEQPEEVLTDDLELVAVITAAITASMGSEVPADGIVVRSIKRARTNKWQKA